MKLSQRIANILVVLGALSLIGDVIAKIFHIRMLGLVPFSFFCLANTCLLLGIAFYVREILIQEKLKNDD